MDHQTEPEQIEQLFEQQQQQQQQAEQQQRQQAEQQQPQPDEEQQQPQRPQEPAGEEPGACSGGPAGAVLSRLQTRFQQASEDLLMAQTQNLELEKRITTLTEQILAVNEEKEALKSEQRAALSRLEEAALTERRRYETALCAARQQQQRGQMDLQLATDELTAVRGQLKALQLEKVALARQVRDLEAEVKARSRLQQSASDQMVRYSQAKNKLNKELASLADWLRRLEGECRAAAELNGRLQLLLQHQSLQLEQLSPAARAAGDGAAGTCPELEQLKVLLAAGREEDGGAGDGPPPPPPPPPTASPPDSGCAAETESRPSAADPPLHLHTERSAPPKEGGEDGPPLKEAEGPAAASETVGTLLLTVPRLGGGSGPV